MLLTIAALVAMLGIVFGGILFWINSYRGLEWVQSRINRAIPGSIAVERHRLSLRKPSLDLYGVVIQDPRGFALAGVAHLAVELDWWALRRREIRLKRVLLQAPWADLIVDEAAGLNLMTALVSPDQEKGSQTPVSERADLPFNIVGESIQLTDGRFTFVPSDGTTHLETTGLTLSAAGDLMARSGNLNLALANVRFSSAGIHPKPASIVLKARLEGDKLHVAALDVTSGQTTLKLSGSADSLYTRPLLDSVFSVDSQLTELKTIFQLAGDYSGSVNASLTLKGAVDNPDAGLVLTVDGARIAGQPLDRGDLSITLRDRQVTVDKATFRHADGRINLDGTVTLREVFPSGFLKPLTDVNAITYALNLVQDIPDLNPWLRPFIDLGGKMTGRVSVTGKGVTPPAITARLTLKGSGQALVAPGIDRPVNANVTLSAEMAGEMISISRLNAAVDGVELSGNGRYQISDRSLAGKLALAADDLSRAFAVMGMASVRGACNAAITVDGHLDRPQFSLDLTSKNLGIDAYSLGDLTIDAGMGPDGLVNLSTLSLQNQDSRIRGNGRLRLLPDGSGLDPGFVNTIDLTLEKLSAADFMKSPPFQGFLDGRLQLDGPLGSLTGELSLSGSALGRDAATIGDVDARLRLNGGTVLMDRLDLRNQDSTLTATGSIKLLTPGTLRLIEDPSFEVTVASDHLDPGDFIDGISGDFSLDGVLTGSLEKPVGRVTLAGRQVDLAGQPVETIAIDARFEDRRLWLDRLLAAVAPGQQITGGGWVGLDKTVDLHVKSDGISVARIQRLHDFFPGDGRLHLDVSAQGHLENPDIDGRLTVSEVVINDGAIQDMHLTFSLHDMLAKATGNLNFGMDAVCDLKKGDFDARLTFDRTETAAYFKAAGKPDFHGPLSGRVQAAGNIRELANASAHLELNALHLLFKETTLVQSDRIVAELDHQELSIPEFEMALLSSGRLRLKGDARLGGNLNLEINGRIPLAAAGVFSDELADTTGILTLAGSIAGDMADPQFNAQIDLENIGILVPGLIQKLHDLNGRIHLTRRPYTHRHLEWIPGHRIIQNRRQRGS